MKDVRKLERFAFLKTFLSQYLSGGQKKQHENEMTN